MRCIFTRSLVLTEDSRENIGKRGSVLADILLVYPKAGHDVRGVSVIAPLAMLTLAGHLQRDFSVKILDHRASDDFENSLAKELAQKPLLVGLSSMTGTQIFHALEINKKVKELSPETPVVWGGMHPTLYPAQTVIKPYIDFVIRGEGEVAITQLARLLADKKTNFETVAGLHWKRGEQICSTPLGEPLDLNESARLPWELVDVEEYTSPTIFLYPGVRRVLPYQGSRGCPFKCTFCSEPVLTKKYRMMNPEKMVQECFEMVERFHLDHIAFFDEEFFVNRKWATRVAEIINGRFTWWAQTRAADLLKVDLKLMEKCGMHVVAPGLESGSDRILKYIKKGEKVSEYVEANHRLAETNIHVQYNFIIGFPTETLSELNQTIDLVLKLLKENPNAVVNQLSPLTPLPGTELLRQVIENFGFKEPERLEDWIQMTRGKQERSWLDKNSLRRVRFLYYTSYFLCTAERYSQKFKIPQWVFKFYSKTVRWRWEKKWFWLDQEVLALRLLFRFFVNPVDYLKDPHFGDAHTAKESSALSVPVKLESLSPTEKKNFIPELATS